MVCSEINGGLESYRLIIPIGYFFHFVQKYLNRASSPDEIAPSNLLSRKITPKGVIFCARYRTRTCDLPGVNGLLYQLS